jgi:hypothetical protein
MTFSTFRCIGGCSHAAWGFVLPPRSNCSCIRPPWQVIASGYSHHVCTAFSRHLLQRRHWWQPEVVSRCVLVRSANALPVCTCSQHHAPRLEAP